MTAPRPTITLTPVFTHTTYNSTFNTKLLEKKIAALKLYIAQYYHQHPSTQISWNQAAQLKVFEKSSVREIAKLAENYKLVKRPIPTEAHWKRFLAPLQVSPVEPSLTITAYQSQCLYQFVKSWKLNHPRILIPWERIAQTKLFAGHSTLQLKNDYRKHLPIPLQL